MSSFNRLVVGLLVLLVVAFAARLIKNRDLSLSTGVLWIGGGFLAILPLIFADMLSFITDVIGAKYPASALTLYAFLFFALVAVGVTARLEKTVLQLTRIERSLALLERRIRLLEKAEHEGSRESSEGAVSES